MPTNQKNQKEQARSLLLRTLALPKSTPCLVLSYIQDEEIRDFIAHACTALGFALISSDVAGSIAGADIFVTDTLHDALPLEVLLASGTVPVLPLTDISTKTFSEFNPMKFEGNAFLFSENESFHILASIMRAYENMRYSGDKRTLLKNVTSTKII